MTASKLRWFQFSLRTLLIVVTLCAVPCSWLAVKMQQARRQREAVKRLIELDGNPLYDWDVEANGRLVLNPQPPGPALFRSVLGNDFFDSVYSVDFFSPFPPIYTRAELRSGMGSRMVCLARLSQLRELELEGYPVDDAELASIKGLGQLRKLRLGSTELTDAGLEHLKGLSQLSELRLDFTSITNKGLEHLKGLSQLQTLDISATKITDAGLEYLDGLSQLKELRLYSTSVSDESVKKLQRALPNCKIER